MHSYLHFNLVEIERYGGWMFRGPYLRDFHFDVREIL